MYFLFAPLCYLNSICIYFDLIVEWVFFFFQQFLVSVNQQNNNNKEIKSTCKIRWFLRNRCAREDWNRQFHQIEVFVKISRKFDIYFQNCFIHTCPICSVSWSQYALSCSNCIPCPSYWGQRQWLPGRTAPTPQTTGELFVIKSDNGEREKKRGKDEEGFSYLFLFHFKLNSLSNPKHQVRLTS